MLVAMIIAINGYILVAPFTPQFSLWLRKHRTQSVAGLPYKTNLDKNSGKNKTRAAIPADNRLVIPKLALNEHIYVGTNPHLVNKGVWARPNASTPPQKSNTVLVGHRFTYDGPATFYSLDKVTTGDPIIVYWQGKEYDYRVATTKVVPPTAVEVEAPSGAPELTVYTCTPLWSATNRLVVVAKLTNQGQTSERQTIIYSPDDNFGTQYCPAGLRQGSFSEQLY